MAAALIAPKDKSWGYGILSSNTTSYKRNNKSLPLIFEARQSLSVHTKVKYTSSLHTELLFAVVFFDQEIMTEN